MINSIEKLSEKDANNEKFEERRRNIQLVLSNFINHLNDSEDIDEALEQVVLRSENKNTNPQNNINLMSIHASKGLEFPYVYLLGAEAKLFEPELASEDEINAERCALFVACSRAENELFLTSSKKRYINGNQASFSPCKLLTDAAESNLINVTRNVPTKQVTFKQMVI